MKRQRFFNGQERVFLRGRIYEKTGYMLHNCTLSQAFRRSSYCAVDGGKSNEMLEFIGDQVLSYYVVKIIAQRCGALNLEGDYTFRVCQNQFSALKQELLSNEAFAKIIDEWAVAEYLIVGRDDVKNEVWKHTKIKADLFEAIIGAIAVDCKWDPEILEAVVNKTLQLDGQIDALLQNEPWQFDMDNAVTKLKELAEKGQCSPPCYEINQIGNEQIWSCNCSMINDVTGVVEVVFAASKKAAKKAAAYLVLCDHFEAANKYGVTQKCGSWIYNNGKLMPGSPQFREAGGMFLPEL